jgi:hypothetical protein
MVIVESIYRYLYVYFSCIDLIDLCLADIYIYIYGACLACLFLWIGESLAIWLITWNSSSCNEMFIDLIIRLHVFFKILYYNFDRLMILFNFNICNCEISKKWIYTILSNSFSRRISGAIYIIWYILWLWE